MATTKILLAVHHPQERRQIMQKLGQGSSEWQLLEASDVTSLEEALNHVSLDMLIVDYHLPYLKAHHVIKRFCQRNPLAAVVVLVPAFAQEMAATAFGTRADAYVIKSEKYLMRLGMTIEIALAAHRSHELAAQEDARRNAVLNSIQDIVFTLDDQERHTGVYGQWLAKVGATPEMFLGKTASEIMGPEAAQVHHAANQKALKGEFVVYEWYQGPRLYRTSLSPMRVNGKVVGLVGVGHDISDIDGAYRTIELQNAALKASANAIVITNRDGVVEWANPAVKALTGYDPAELIGQTPRVLNSGKQESAYYEQMWRSILSGQAWHGELVNKRKDGSLYTEEMTITPVDHQGQLSHFVAVKQDITQRIQIQKALQESEQLYKTLVDSLPVGVIWQSADGKIVTANHSAERILGINRLDLVKGGVASLLVRCFSEEGRPLAAEDWPGAQALSTGQSQNEVLIGVYQPDGLLRWLRVNAEPLLAASQSAPYAVVVSFADVTDSKAAQGALRESQLHLEQAQRAAGLGSWEIDLTTQRIYWSDRTHEIYGVPTGTPLTPETYWGFVHPNDLAMVQAAWQDALVSGYLNLEHRILVGGQVRWVQLNAGVLWDANGQPFRAVGAVQDITQRKESEEALQQSEMRYRTLADTASDLIYIFNDDYILEYINPAAAKVVQESPANMVGKTLLEISPDLMQAYGATIEPMFTSLESRYIEGMVPMPTGNVWLGTWLSPLRIVEGKVKSVLGISRDVTAQRLLQEELMQLAQNLEERVADRSTQLHATESRLNYLVNNAPVVIFTVDKQTTETTYLTRSVVNVLGYRLGETRSHISVHKELVYPEDKPIFEEFVQHSLHGEIHTVELRVVHQNNGVRWCRLGGTLSALGELVGYLVDIHEQHQAQQALLEAAHQLEVANRELAQASRTKDEFLATMSHELRTPLTGILGISDLLEQGVYGSLSEAQQQAVGNIGHSGLHLLALINDVLDVAKLQAGKMELNLDRISVEELCQSSLQIVRQLAQNKNLQIDYEPAASALELYADMRRLKQVLVNLLSNAIKFTPEGKQVGLRVKSDNHNVCFEVWDQGIGIDPEDQKRLFRPFEQVNNHHTRKESGTGLGLSLVKYLAEMHGGKVHMHSQKGAGSTFEVYIPLTEVNGVVPLSLNEVQDRPCADPPSAAFRSVLLVEDNPVTLKLIKDFLLAKGFGVITANQGLEAIELFGQEHPSVVLMDIQMPIMDGLEAMRHIRQMPGGLGVRIIAISAQAMPQDKERCLEAGANAYLSKPLNLQALLEAMASIPPTALTS